MSLSSTGHAQDRDQARSQYIFGMFAYEKGDYEGAEKDFKKALDLEPGNALYNNYMGKTYLKMEMYGDALSCLDKAYGTDPDIYGLAYDLAMANYRLNDYEKALEYFDRVIKEDPSNILAHYHAGISLYKQQEYGKALAHFLEASEGSPTIKANGYYYAGICNFMMGDLDQASEKLEYARDNSESEAIRENAKQWLDSIQRETKASKPYSIFAKAGYQYDSNVLLEFDEDLVAEADDTAFTVYLWGKYRFLKRDNLSAGMGYNHYQILYRTLEEYNLTNGILNLYGKYDKGPFEITLSYLPHFSWLDSKKYMKKQEFKADISYDLREDLTAEFSYSYYDINHLVDDNRDGKSNIFTLNTFYILGENAGYVFAGIGYEDRSAGHPDYYYSQVKAQAGISLEIPLNITLDLKGSYGDIGYENVNSAYGIKREDKRYAGSVALSRSIFYEWLSFIAEFDYTGRGSNIDEYEYSRKVGALSLSVKF
jgi:tetratricopeptide (TPR) repeat protein